MYIPIRVQQLRANSPLLVLLKFKWIIILPLSRSIGGWATPESAKKAGTTGFTKELNAFLLGWSLFLWVCLYTGFPNTLVRGCVFWVTCSMRMQWKHWGVLGKEQVRCLQWPEAIRKHFMREFRPFACVPTSTPAVLRKGKWGMFLRDWPYAVLTRFWLPNRN